MTKNGNIPIVNGFVGCLLAALVIWLGYLYAWDRHLHQMNTAVLSMLPPSQKSEILETIKRRSGRCRIHVVTISRRDWCGAQIDVVHLDCRFVRGMFDRHGHRGPGDQCTVVAKEGGPITVVGGDLHDSCPRFGKVLAHGNPTPNHEEIREIGTMWQLATPWEKEAYDRGVAFPPNHEYVFEQYSKDVVTWLHAQFDEEGRLLGTSIKYKRLPGPFQKLPFQKLPF